MSPALEDLADYVDRALDSMGKILTDLGDDLANRSPDLPRANTAFAILTHCLGVMNYWAGWVATGRPIQRNREEEFRARGSVDDLLDKVEAAKVQLREDLEKVRWEARVVNQPPEDSSEETFRQSSVLLHVLEELCQHLGHMEITRDLLLRDVSRP